VGIIIENLGKFLNWMTYAWIAWVIGFPICIVIINKNNKSRIDSGSLVDIYLHIAVGFSIIVFTLFINVKFTLPMIVNYFKIY
jgi:hypothetical protein